MPEVTVAPQETQVTQGSQATTTVAPQVSTQPQASQTPEPDLITRVSQVKVEAKPVESTTTTDEFDFKEIENIQDPKHKDLVLKAYKSMQRGVNDKFQELAKLRKTYEAEIAKNTNWSAERIQQLLKDPSFVDAVKTTVSSQAPSTFTGSQEEWSGLNETEKARFNDLDNRLRTQEQQAFFERKNREDEQLKSRYGNYNPQAIDTLTSDMLANKVQATREHLWKVLDYDEAVKRAYELGKQDGNKVLKEKVGVSSVEGITTTTVNGEPAKKLDNENTTSFLKRLYFQNVNKNKP